MRDLTNLQLKYSYHKGEDDIAGEFYSPCLLNSVTYDRAVGYFSSSIYSICWDALKTFIQNGGKMRFVCSPILSSEDKDSLYEGYSMEAEKKFSEEFQKEFKSLLSNPYLERPAKIIASLVALGILDFKIVFLTSDSGLRQKRIFHDKLGIFSDTVNKVVFKGSMNETWTGLSNDGNLESVDVFISWSDSREKDRINNEVEYFENLWEDRFPNTKVVHFPDVAKQALIDVSQKENINVLIDEINEKIEFSDKFYAEIGTNRRKIKPHQSEALQNWINNNRRGIFQHATGSGKTFTGICAIRDSLSKSEVPLILVPSELLLYQWYNELKTSLTDLEISFLLCGGGNTRWRTEKLLRIWSNSSKKNKVIIATNQTASSDVFLKLLKAGSHLFLLADEVHNLGSFQNRKILQIESGPRLGLSATPRRAGDIEGTSMIFSYFDKIILPTFDLQDAIKSKVLTPYMYYIYSANLSDVEQEQWISETREILKLIHQSKNREAEEFKENLKLLLIRRSKITKNAKSKIDLAINIIRNNYSIGQRWIVYCDSGDQVIQIRSALKKNNIESHEYQSNMSGDRSETFKYFNVVGGIIVAIKCLDEGIDIPSVSHALILASSRNPREFIQRRGRVLRKAENKNLAYIHDILITPTKQVDNNEYTDLLTLEGELLRALEFGQHSLNPSSTTDIKRIALEFKIDFDLLKTNGIEYE